MISDNPYGFLADRIEGIAVQVREIEAQAYKALYEDKDDLAYREFMRRKAMTLADLAEDVAVHDLPVTDSVKKRIKRFSFSAAQSLEIGSVFFMSALLYPEDHEAGEPNDLDNFVAELKSLS
ncbi:hypothetical protein [Maridesulfovibrio sp.]|uniref:hypothetical protein n=1 Tax=Maridesulfovibrio sp. TaxID=2795000 RepID=UPI0029C9D5A6|nr:hypothetical protein [Maridesulfovibrio sp.]